MNDPIAFFLTWPTYGTWLPGDARGWVEFKHGWQLPSDSKETDSQMKMNEDACLLTEAELAIVEAQIIETCRHRNWTLFAISLRSNHIHVVVGATDTDPKKIRVDLKAWSTRRLKEQSNSDRENWWAERGSIRWVFDECGLDNVIRYVTEAQDRKHLDRPIPTRSVSEDS